MQFNVRGKKITIMGLGLLGRGVGDALFLASKGAQLLITDKKTRKELAPSLRKLQTIKAKYVLGKHRKEDFEGRDYILKGAGIPLDSEYIAHARKKGVPVKMDESWFAEYCPAPIIGVTGTRGKTTVTHLMYAILKAAGMRAHIGGNIPGIATLPLLGRVRSADRVVLELSSWQLQGWHDERLSPHIAVITNIYEDHLNYYKGSMTRYVHDKAAIFAYQTPHDVLVLNKRNPYSKKFAQQARGRVLYFSASDLPASWNVPLLGEHNRENIAAAIAVAKAMRIPMKTVRRAIESFKGVSHRLELVRTRKGVSYYNDTTATSPEAVVYALRSFSQPIVLLAGGIDKTNNKMSTGVLPREIHKRTKALILFKGKGSTALEHALHKMRYSKPIVTVSSVREAVAASQKLLQPGDVFLLSPGGASFELFKNEYDRGEQFVRAVKRLRS